MVHSPTDLSILDTVDREIAKLCLANIATGSISIGLTGCGFSNSSAGDQFLFWCPDGFPQGSSTLIASSRLGRKPDEATEWFDGLRTVAAQLDGQADFLITAPGTTTNPFVRRVAELKAIPILEFLRFPKRPTRKWLNSQQIGSLPTTRRAANPYRVFYKPIHSTLVRRTTGSKIDELLTMLAQTVVLLAVRKNGNIYHSARRRLKSPTHQPTRLLINGDQTPPSVKTELLELGASGWWLYSDLPHVPTPTSTPAFPNSVAAKSPSESRVLKLDQIQPRRYMAHWTRRRLGPWPDQTETEYLDDLIFQSPGCQHGELAALCRILASRRILGSHSLTRTGRDVCCFSNQPIDRLLEQRVYRSHLGRWDFEPYGIAIDREKLKQLGARPVIYGDESTWNHLSNSEQAFFQRTHSTSGEMDWTREREWRLLGDLNLDLIPGDQAIVFVKTQSDAEFASRISRWPVVSLTTAK